MKNIKIIFVALILTLMSCNAGTGSMGNVQTDKIQYYQDKRTGLCFAVLGSKKAVSMETTGMGMTCVPCESVETYLLN